MGVATLTLAAAAWHRDMSSSCNDLVFFMANGSSDVVAASLLDTSVVSMVLAFEHNFRKGFSRVVDNSSIYKLSTMDIGSSRRGTSHGHGWEDPAVTVNNTE